MAACRRWDSPGLHPPPAWPLAAGSDSRSACHLNGVQLIRPLDAEPHRETSDHREEGRYPAVAVAALSRTKSMRGEDGAMPVSSWASGAQHDSMPVDDNRHDSPADHSSPVPNRRAHLHDADHAHPHPPPSRCSGHRGSGADAASRSRTTLCDSRATTTATDTGSKRYKRTSSRCTPTRQRRSTSTMSDTIASSTGLRPQPLRPSPTMPLSLLRILRRRRR